ALSDYLRQHQVTTSSFPTRMGELLMDHLPDSFRCLVVGGEELKKTFADNRVRLGNICGPSECTVAISATCIEANSQNITIGKPVYNTRSYVLDEHMQPVPIGVAGEWHVSGYALTSGYLYRPELNKQRFGVNPFICEDDPEAQYHRTLYKVGDIVSWTEEGNLKFQGRKDFQAKIRGFRVELGEIEFHLSHHPQISGVLVQALEDSCSKYLCAWYESGTEIEQSELKAYLSTWLADYMIPELFIWLPQMPMNTNGKIDRRALPKPDRGTLANHYVAPVTQQEQQLCQEFARVLELERVGLTDDFFSLGGNSLKAIRLVATLQQNFRITVADLFTWRTPQAIAANVAWMCDNRQQQLERIKAHYQQKAQMTAREESHATGESTPALLRRIPDSALQPRPLQTVLLTGATGYLGCHLLEQLLKQTSSRLCLLIRGKDAQQAWQRLDQRFQRYFDQSLQQWESRLEVLAADIEQRHLGLDPVCYQRLLQEVNSVLHCAALVKHYGDYEQFYSANVQATAHLLEFAREAKSCDLHYISTVSVLCEGYVPGEREWTFDDGCDGSQLAGRENYYASSKYEGERLCLKYRDLGV
ncbi:MAG: SDR family oxidoreductase, partial [Enterobacteriaceae bacterium]